MGEDIEQAMISLTDAQIGIIAFACKTSVERLNNAIADANEGQYERLKDYGYSQYWIKGSPEEYFDNLLKRIGNG